MKAKFHSFVSPRVSRDDFEFQQELKSTIWEDLG